MAFILRIKVLYKSFIKNQEARSSKENTGNVWQGEYAGSTKTKCTFIRSFLQWIFQCFSYILQVNNNRSYYSFKIFSLFWLVKTTHIIHHNQLLFTKFGKNLRHIESMMSKVEPSEKLLNQWRQNLRHIESMTSKVQPAADYWTVDRDNLGTRLCYIWWAEKQRA